MGWVWQELQSEWAVVGQAPLFTCFVWAVGLVVIGLLMNRFYRYRLERREDVLRMYQQKLGLGPHKKSPYAKLKNKELREKATDLAQNIRAFTAVAESQLRASPADLGNFWPYVAGQFANSFKVESVLVRDEIMKRLEKTVRDAYQRSDPKGGLAFIYQNPVNTAGMEKVADDLDKLAKLLASQ